MSLRAEIEKKIEKKRQEIQGLERKIKEGQAYIQGLEDVLRILPEEEVGEGITLKRASPALNGRRRATASSDAALRPGGDVHRAWELIKQAGKPLHINDLITRLGKPLTSKNKKSLAGTINNYVREGRIFNRPKPNTFGLLDTNSDSTWKVEDEIPEDFGLDKPEEVTPPDLAEDDEQPF